MCGEVCVCVFKRNVWDVDLRACTCLGTNCKNLCRAVNVKAEYFQCQLKLLFLDVKTCRVVWSVSGATAGCPRELLGSLGWKHLCVCTPGTLAGYVPPSFLLLLTALLKAVCSPNATLCQNCWCCNRAVHHTLKKIPSAWGGAMMCLQVLVWVTASHCFSGMPVVDPIIFLFFFKLNKTQCFIRAAKLVRCGPGGNPGNLSRRGERWESTLCHHAAQRPHVSKLCCLVLLSVRRRTVHFMAGQVLWGQIHLVNVPEGLSKTLCQKWGLALLAFGCGELEQINSQHYWARDEHKNEWAQINGRFGHVRNLGGVFLCREVSVWTKLQWEQLI